MYKTLCLTKNNNKLMKLRIAKYVNKNRKSPGYSKTYGRIKKRPYLSPGR